MKRTNETAAVAVVLVAMAQGAAGQGKPGFWEPSLAPGRAEIAFVSGGDIWAAPLAGGEARLLVSHPAAESRPLFSPDGTQLAFVSTRTGNGDVYVLKLATGELRRLTHHDGIERLDAWSRDGRHVYFSGSARDISGMSDIFRVAAEGGTPVAVSGDRYASEFFGAPSPDGNWLAMSARGVGAVQWWRNGKSHLDCAQICVRKLEPKGAYQELTGVEARNLWPMWSPDGKKLYFVSNGATPAVENLWELAVGSKAAPRRLTSFGGGRVLWPSIGYDGKTIVFERDFGIWSLDVATGKAGPVALTLRGSPAGPGVEHLTLNSRFRDLALSPDGKKIAFVARGEVFAAGAKDGGAARRLTNTAATEAGVHWSPDSRRVLYQSERNGTVQLFVYDFTAGTETQLTAGGWDLGAKWSPDGKQVAFMRGGAELRVVDVASKQERVLARGQMARGLPGRAGPLEWSADGKWIAFLQAGEKLFRNVWLVEASGGNAPVQASFLANTFSSDVVWSKDGGWLLFSTTQRTEPARIARVDLTPRTPPFREEQFQALFEEPKKSGGAAGAAAEATTAAVKQPVWDGIRQRLRYLPLGLDAQGPVLSPDGKTLLFAAETGGQENLYTYSLDELATARPTPRQLTSTSGGKSDAQFSPDGKEVYFLEEGRVQVASVDTRAVRAVAVTAELDVDFDREKKAVFEQAWLYTNETFYDPKFHGVDWPGVKAWFAPQVEGARTPAELRRLLTLMVGELDASHLGASNPASEAVSNSGNIGVRFDWMELERNGRYRVSEVIALGPAAISGIRVGDEITAVDGTALGAGSSFDLLLEHKTGKRVMLTLAGGKQVAVRPVSSTAEKQLLYRDWVESRRQYVSRVSEGKLGYVHLYDMSSDALDQLAIDLDAENHSRQGVVIDVRNNNGGFVNAYALDVFARKPYLVMTPRGMAGAAGRSLLGQRSLERPTVLVTNQHSLSDAEDFTEGYRAMKLGQVVGEPTSGWIVYTSNVPLIDGTVYRLPSTRVETLAGENMERKPRPVDVPVRRPMGESESGTDAQLDAAIRVLTGTAGR